MFHLPQLSKNPIRSPGSAQNTSYLTSLDFTYHVVCDPLNEICFLRATYMLTSIYKTQECVGFCSVLPFPWRGRRWWCIFTNYISCLLKIKKTSIYRLKAHFFKNTLPIDWLIDLLHFSPAGYPTRHLVTRTSLLSLRVQVHGLLSRIRASTIHSHMSTYPPPRRIQPTHLYKRTSSLARTIQHSPLAECK